MIQMIRSNEKEKYFVQASERAIYEAYGSRTFRFRALLLLRRVVLSLRAARTLTGNSLIPIGFSEDSLESARIINTTRANRVPRTVVETTELGSGKDLVAGAQCFDFEDRVAPELRNDTSFETKAGR